MSNSELQKNILSTIAYYDGMDYPMTNFEAWKYLTVVDSSQPASTRGDSSTRGGSTVHSNNSERYSLPEVINELDSENLKKFIEEFRGFYFLRGRKDLVEKRLAKNKIANQKIKTVLNVAKWLRFVPFVRMVAVTGSLAMKNTTADSDLDLLLVLKNGKIFTGRTLVTGLIHLLGKRRHGKKVTDRVCLNYFITDHSLEITLKDLFSASEYSFIFPVFGWHIFQRFQAANLWIKKYKPNFQPDEMPNLKYLKETYWTYRSRLIGEALLGFDFVESRLKKWQTRRIANDPRTKKEGSMVVANDEMLIFLPNPQGPQIFEKFKKGLGELI